MMIISYEPAQNFGLECYNNMSEMVAGGSIAITTTDISLSDRKHAPRCVLLNIILSTLMNARVNVFSIQDFETEDP